MSIGIHNANNNVNITLVVSERNVAVDISSATTKQMLFKKPSGTVDTQTTTFTSDGTDGKMYYNLLTADIDETGEWEVQGKVILTGGTYTTEIHKFTVYGNLA